MLNLKPIFLVVLLTVVSSVYAQFQVGTPGSNGLIPQLDISSNRIGSTAAVTIRNPALQAQEVFILLGTQSLRQRFPQFEPSPQYRAVLGVQPSDPSNFLILRMRPQGSLSLPVVGGLPIFLQALVLDPGATGGLAISPAVSFVAANPMNKAIGRSPDPQHWYAASGALDPRTGIMYVFGGRQHAGGYPGPQHDTVDAINPSNPGGFEVQNVGRCPYTFDDGAAVWDLRNNVAYVIGGTSNTRSPPGPVDTILKFNPATGQCTVFDSLPIPIHYVRTSAVVDDTTGLVYIFGGLSVSIQDTVILFDPNAPAGSRTSILNVRIPQPVTLPGSAARDPLTGDIYYLVKWCQSRFRFMS